MKLLNTQWNQHPAGTDGSKESSHDADHWKNRHSLVLGFLRILPGNSPLPSPLCDLSKSEGYEFASNRDLGEASDVMDEYLSHLFDIIQSSSSCQTSKL